MRRDPVFDLPTPIVFAHRGGAGEVPESTEEAFRHAVTVGADVLELDVRITTDGQLVVWHGPNLDNVYDAAGTIIHTDIRDMEWPKLEGKAWVCHPERSQERARDPKRTLLSLERFIEVARTIESELAAPRQCIPWNIELKSGKGWRDGITTLLAVLAPEAERRRIVLAVAHGSNVSLLRHAMEQSAYADKFSVNQSGGQQLADRLRGYVGLAGERLDRRTVQTSHALVTPKFVADVHARGGAVHPFLSSFGPLCGIDGQPEIRLRAAVHRLLDAGVDGLMTDYPSRVVPLVRDWSGFRSRPVA